MAGISLSASPPASLPQNAWQSARQFARRYARNGFYAACIVAVLTLTGIFSSFSRDNGHR